MLKFALEDFFLGVELMEMTQPFAFPLGSCFRNQTNQLPTGNPDIKPCRLLLDLLVHPA